jgi:uncharacterized YigZ family protein
MLFDDTYYILRQNATGEIRERGSRFMAYAFSIRNEEEVKQHLTALKKEHYNAAHHCYAFVLGMGKEMQKFNDDREPSNSAGRPILRAILSQDLTNTLVVVVRYFGGKLLGVPGLIAAYEGAALAALATAGKVKKEMMERYVLRFDYDNENEAFRIIKQFGLKVLQHQHGDEIVLIFEVRRNLADMVLQSIHQNHRLNIKPA